MVTPCGVGVRNNKRRCHCLQVALATTLQRVGGVGLDRLTKTKAASELLQVSKAAFTSCHVRDSAVQFLCSSKPGPPLNVEEHVAVSWRIVQTQPLRLSALKSLMYTSLCLSAAELEH